MNRSSHTNSPIRLLINGALVIFVFYLAGQASAEIKAAVTLRYFRAAGLEDSVLLEWATATEFNTAGFRLERSSTRNGTYLPLDAIGFVPAAGDPIGGYEYSYTDDENTVIGSTYWYRLVEIEFNNNENLHGPITVSIGANVASPTVGITESASPGYIVTSTQSVTPTPSLTPSPSSTAIIPILQIAGTSTRIASQTNFGSTANTQVEQALSGPGSSNNQVIAQAGTPVNPEGYPGLPLATLASVTGVDETLDSSYPGISTPVFGEDLTPYPAVVFEGQAGGNQANLATQAFIQAVGSESSSALSAQAQEVDGNGIASTAFLWIGFLAALIVFVAGIYASIYLYVRRGNSN